MTRSVFISYNHKDKSFVKYLAARLIASGAKVWVDDGEINVGDSLITKIVRAIKQTDFVIAIISSNSVKSKWVQKELSLAMSKEVVGKRLVVLPVKIDNCKMPLFLRDKMYCNFSSAKLTDWRNQYLLLLRSIGLNPSDAKTIKKHNLPFSLTLPAILKKYMIQEKDCRGFDSIEVEDIMQDGIRIPLHERVLGRIADEEFAYVEKDKKKQSLKSGDMINSRSELPSYNAGCHSSIRIRSIFTCSYPRHKNSRGVCALCYGTDSATGQLVRLGKDVGLVASKSILSAINSIKDTSSLHKILNPQSPKDGVILSPCQGIVRIKPYSLGTTHIAIKNSESDTSYYCITKNEPLVRNGATVFLGQMLTKGHLDIQSILDIFGQRYTQQYVMRSLRTYFLSRGLIVNERDLEIIVAIMTSYVRVDEYYEYEPEYELMRGKILPIHNFININDSLANGNKKPLIGEPVILGVDEIYNYKPINLSSNVE